MQDKKARQEREARFYAAWKLCAACDQCGKWNTPESRRVFRAWREAGCPALVHKFILRHAAHVAGGKP